MRTVIVSAAKFEALPLLEALDDRSFPYEHFEIGIGPLNSVLSLEKLKTICEGCHVIFLGSCGTFGNFSKPFLITSEKTLWMPAGIRTGISDFSDDWYPEKEFKNLNKKVCLEKKIILTSPEISLTKELKRKSLGENPESYCENMELYCVAEALNKASLLTLVLGVTNEICLHSRSQWMRNFKEITFMTKDYLLPLLMEKTFQKPTTLS